VLIMANPHLTPKISPEPSGPMGELVSRVTQSVATVPYSRERNYERRCISLFDTCGYPCGKPTVKCPGCLEPTDFCEDCLFEQPDGTRVCPECGGSPRFSGGAA
jgi:hypothetical protein